MKSLQISFVFNNASLSPAYKVCNTYTNVKYFNMCVEEGRTDDQSVFFFFFPTNQKRAIRSDDVCQIVFESGGKNAHHKKNAHSQRQQDMDDVQ
jgi:hypothetical protein